jgi:SAM-dependent methyltransferase
VSWHTRKWCALCGGTMLERVFSLEPTPAANEFRKPEDKDAPIEYFPLDVALCGTCGHAQLMVVVDPERLFRHYVYVSGTSSSFVRHFARYATDVVGQTQVKGRLVVDVGSNDGSLLRFFRAMGARVVGVDPALEIAEEARKSGIETIPRFFDRMVAQEIIRVHGPAHVVTANNVFAHAENLRELAKAVLSLLDDDGIFVFEVSYLLDVVQHLLFDTIYHEHLSYHAVKPLLSFFNGLGATLYRVERQTTHGGSIRCYVKKGEHPTEPSVEYLLAAEELLRLSTPEPFIKLRQDINVLGQKVQKAMSDLWVRSAKVAGFGAPAKMTTLCHEFRIDATDLVCVADDSPWKQGRLTPGLQLPVVRPLELYALKPDAVVVFAWNFAEQIIKAHSNLHTKWIVPLPAYREIET